MKEYKEDFDKYKDRKKAIPLKGADREQFTLNLLSKFKAKLQSAKEKEQESNSEATREDEESDDW